MVLLKQYNLTNYISDNILTIPSNIILQSFDTIFSWYIEKINPLSSTKGTRIAVPGKWDSSLGLIVDLTEFTITPTNYIIGVYGSKDTGDDTCIDELVFNQSHHWVVNYNFDVLTSQPLLFDLDGKDLIIDNKVQRIIYDTVEKQINVYFKEVVTGNLVITGKCKRDNDGELPISIITTIIPEY